MVGKHQMLRDLDLWRAAYMVLRQPGEGAAEFVAARIGDLGAEGDELGCATWGLILLRIAELRRGAADGEAVH